MFNALRRLFTSKDSFGLLAITGGLAKIWVWCCYIWPLPPQNIHALEWCKAGAELMFVMGILVVIFRARHIIREVN